MMRAGVVGDPIAHSLSPLIHTAWIEGLGLDAVYERFHVAAEDFPDFVRGRARDLKGVNVTIPHKEAALALAEVKDRTATSAKAANVLLFGEGGRIEARNTDGVGLLGALRARASGFDPAAAPILLLGAGGAARGALAALVEAGATDVRVANRTRARADLLAADFPGQAKAFSLAEEDLGTAASEVGAVINATSLGLGGAGAPEVAWERTLPEAVAMDMVYKPLDTTFLQRARAAGRGTVDGLEMLIRQAVPSFEYFFGVAPPETVDVRSLCLKALA